MLVARSYEIQLEKLLRRLSNKYSKIPALKKRNAAPVEKHLENYLENYLDNTTRVRAAL